MKPPTRLAIFLTLAWFLFLAIANYTTVSTESEFAHRANGQPLPTLLVHDAGWPAPCVQQVYWRVPYPRITWDVNGAKLAQNVLLIALVHVALGFLVWRKTTFALWDLFALTAVAAIVMTSAVSSEDRFGGTVRGYIALYAYIAPLAIAAIRLPVQLVNGALYVLRISQRMATEQPRVPEHGIGRSQMENHLPCPVTADR